MYLRSIAFLAGLLLAGSSVGQDVLPRGPIHEAFATPSGVAAVPTLVAKLPPDPVLEQIPAQKPATEGIRWIPGYWDYDDDRAGYLWISGCWRVPPPGRVWVPGGWREVQGGWQRSAGFWLDATRVQPDGKVDLTFNPPPPPVATSLPIGPAPTNDSFAIPATWTGTAWQAGTWETYRPERIWVPTHHRWTPAGYLTIDGYWDYRLSDRGVLFASLAVTQEQTRITPTHVVNLAALPEHLFLKAGATTYFFGDYFDPRSTTRGYTPWCGATTSSSFAAVRGSATPADLMWVQTVIEYRSDPGAMAAIVNGYTARYRGEAPRPTRSVEQTRYVATAAKGSQPVAMVTGDAGPTWATTTMLDTSFPRMLSEVATQRRRVETAIADRGQTPRMASDKVPHGTLVLPKPLAVAAIPADRAMSTDLRNIPLPPVLVPNQIPMLKDEPMMPKVSDLIIPAEPVAPALEVAPQPRGK